MSTKTNRVYCQTMGYCSCCTPARALFLTEDAIRRGLTEPLVPEDAVVDWHEISRGETCTGIMSKPTSLCPLPESEESDEEVVRPSIRNPLPKRRRTVTTNA